MPLPLGLDLQERHECVHLLLHRLEPRERVELRLELLERARRLGTPERIELVGDPVTRLAAAGREPVTQDAEAACDVFEGIPGHLASFCPSDEGLSRRRAGTIR